MLTPLRFLRSLLLNRAITTVSAQLAAQREILEEAESDYSEFYPTDDSVSRIITLRRSVLALQERLAGLHGQLSELESAGQ